MTWQPLAVDLFCGLGGWTEGLLAEGYRVVGFDLERHHYGEAKYPAQLVLQDVLTIHGRQFKDAALIVASPPCLEFSYMAMPWSRAKQIEAEYLDGTRNRADLTALFDACFRIQREAIEAAGHHIPLVVENVRGAQKWVGQSRWNFGSFHLWGDVPALMPIPSKRGWKGSVGTINGSGKRREQSSWDRGEGHKNPGFRFDGSGGSFQTASVEGMKNTGGSWFNIGSPRQKETNMNPVHALAAEGVKHGGDCFNDPSWAGKQGGQKTVGHSHTRHLTNQAEHGGIKQGGISGPRINGKGDAWFQDGAAQHGSKSPARKAASAHIAKIPFVLASWIARAHKPMEAIA